MNQMLNSKDERSINAHRVSDLERFVFMFVLGTSVALRFRSEVVAVLSIPDACVVDGCGRKTYRLWGFCKSVMCSLPSSKLTGAVERKRSSKPLSIAWFLLFLEPGRRKDDKLIVSTTTEKAGKIQAGEEVRNAEGTEMCVIFFGA